MGFIIIFHYCWFVLSGNNFSQNFNFSPFHFYFFLCGKNEVFNIIFHAFLKIYIFTRVQLQ